LYKKDSKCVKLAYLTEVLLGKSAKRKRSIIGCMVIDHAAWDNTSI